MTLAVMTRASLGHTGRELSASVGTQAIYALVVAGALARICASIEPDWSAPLLLVSGVVWAAAFGGFAASLRRRCSAGRAWARRPPEVSSPSLLAGERVLEVHALPDEMRLHPSRKQRAEFTPRSDAIGIPRIAKDNQSSGALIGAEFQPFPLNGVKSTSAAASRRYKLRRRTIGHHSYRNISDTGCSRGTSRSGFAN